MGHDHDGHVAFEQRKALRLVLAMTVAILCAEIVGGVLADSLVLFADAGHIATDTVGIGLSLFAAWFSTRPPNDSRTFGYQRTEIFAAVVNAVLLLAVGLFVIGDGAWRLSRPGSPNPSLMIGFGIVALVGNGIGAAVLHRGHDANLNVRSAFLEVCSDLLGAVAILVAAIVIETTGYRQADPLASIVIGVLILPRTANLLRGAVDVLLEATPKDVDLAQVRAHICETPGVIDVHDLHAWTVTSGVPVLSAHVVVDEATLVNGGAGRVLDRLAACLSGHFDVDHCTFQLEPTTHRDHEHSIHAYASAN